MLHAVIMAGGAGTRFWPASRTSQPKQLLKLAGERTMIQATVDRLAGVVPPERILIVTNQSLVAPIAAQLPEVPAAGILGEPCKRDTAPCVGLAAALIARQDPEATLVVMPADHVIEPCAAFRQAIQAAAELVAAAPDTLVTFGIPPTYPATAYGYIERGERWNGGPADISAYRVARFREKPHLEKAQEFLQTGRFYWNAGIFVWRAHTILETLRRFEPAMVDELDAIVAAAGTPSFEDVFARHFAAIQGKSIDYAVLEKYPQVAVIEPAFTWDDVGNWTSLARTRGTDEHGNTFVGKHVALDTQGSIVCGHDDHLIVTIGLQDVIVVHTPDATLVVPKSGEDGIRQVVKRLQDLGWHEYL